jgi:hypothetical protein
MVFGVGLGFWIRILIGFYYVIYPSRVFHAKCNVPIALLMSFDLYLLMFFSLFI